MGMASLIWLILKPTGAGWLDGWMCMDGWMDGWMEDLCSTEHTKQISVI